MRRALLRTAQRAALKDAKAEGCVCTPDISIGRKSTGALLAVVLHDQWCPMAQLAGEQRDGQLYRETFIDPEEK